MEQFVAGGNVEREGLGAALMEDAGRRAADGGSELRLEVWKVNRRAVNFYERLGFSVSRTTDDPATGLEKVVMRRNTMPTS
jgi:ribosomal protein S18 acetylase RimI-like enzyme